MTFVYSIFEFYRISNVIACETLNLSYNGEFNLDICPFFFSFFFNLYIHVMISQIYYIYIIKKKNYLTLWLNH